MNHPLRVYAAALRRPSGAVLRVQDGTTLPLPVDRYLGPADQTDRQLLTGIRGPVLDVGCGPGRHLHALAACGVFALGVDLSPAAVELATERGVRAVVASVFDELPGAGSWRTALLLDGNIGIGGDSARLLARIGALLRDDGELLVELGAPDEPTESTLVQVETCDAVSSWFPWARVSVRDVDGLAQAGGLEVHRRWSSGGRWFARLGVLGGQTYFSSRPISSRHAATSPPRSASFAVRSSKSRWTLSFSASAEASKALRRSGSGRDGSRQSR
jgi:SAM-dependent methyltransferase